MIEEDEPILEKAIGYVITDICKKKITFLEIRSSHVYPKLY
jgi:hypothetical protein